MVTELALRRHVIGTQHHREGLLKELKILVFFIKRHTYHFTPEDIDSITGVVSITVCGLSRVKPVAACGAWFETCCVSCASYIAPLLTTDNELFASANVIAPLD